MTEKAYLSIKNVKDCLIRFLESDEASIVAIRGAWGVGKTYFWNELVAEVANSSIHPNIKIKKNCIIGIGSALINNTKEGKTYFGNPARVL